MIELFTKGLGGVELTRKMCEIEQVSRVMWRIAHEHYAITKNLPRPEHELAQAIIQYNECDTASQTKRAYASMLRKAEICLHGRPLTTLKEV